MKWFMWAFMLACNLIVPGVMLVFGRKFIKQPPKAINSTYGYRTSMSMKNQETWDFAHQTCGALWQRTGRAMVPFVVLAQGLLLLCPTTESMCLWSLVPTMLEVVVLVATIFPVERALKRNFDGNGMRQ